MQMIEHSGGDLLLESLDLVLDEGLRSSREVGVSIHRTVHVPLHLVHCNQAPSVW